MNKSDDDKQADSYITVGKTIVETLDKINLPNQEFINGVGKGLIDATSASQQRQNALDELDAQARRDRRASQVASTGDPVIDTLNHGFATVVDAITGEGEKSRTLTTTIDLIDKGTTFIKERS